MANITITDNDVGGVVYSDAKFRDDTLNLSGASTVAEGTILARDSVSGKLVYFVPGGEARKAGGTGPFVLDAGDTMVINTNAGGNETATFDAAAGRQDDNTTYTGGTAASITDTTVYACADQDGLTAVVTTTDAINGTVVTTVTFVGATTTAAAVAAGFAAQVPHITAVVAGGQVLLTTDAGGVDATIAVAAGTGGLLWANPATPGAGGLADQDGLAMTVTIDGGAAQTVTFSGLTTEVSQIAAAINAQTVGCSANVVGGQVRVTSDSQGTGSSVAMAAGTSGLTFGAAVAGTGDVVNIKAVTSTEVKTVVEADTTDLTVTVSGASFIMTADTSIAFVSGDALVPCGLSVETITANENGVPKAVMTYELAGANGDNAVRPLVSGNVRDEKLVINSGASMTAAIRDQLRAYGIVPLSVDELMIPDNS